MKNTMSRTTIILAAALFATAAPSVAMAQVASISAPASTQAETYNEPSQKESSFPIEAYTRYDYRFVGVAAGNT
jgi:hypothetical protein